MTTKLPRRDEVPVALTWNLTTIFPNDDAWQQSLDEVKQQADQAAQVKGSLGNSAQALLTGLQKIFAVMRKFEKVYIYASLKADQDTTNTKYQAFNAQVESLGATIDSKLAFLEPEIIAIPNAKLQQFITSEPQLHIYQHLLDEITQNRDHVLPAEQEALLAAASDIFSAPRNTFDTLNDTDIEFGTITDENGQQIQLSDGIYGKLIESTDRHVRKAAFQTLYKTYHDLRHTFAMTLASDVKVHNYDAKVHHYSDSRTAEMSHNHIPVSVYDTLVTTVNKHLDLLHHYVALRKQILNVNQLHMYDMYVPLVGEPPLTYTYEAAQQEALKALAVMGDDYLNHVKEIYNNRYIDVVENKGKRSGAYSGGGYDTNPFILLNWQDNLNNLYTLIHETGHSVHSWYTNHNQPYIYGDYPIFVAEIASTTNENILTNYLLATQQDPKVRAYVLNYYLDGFKGTVFRQTQFAEFEQYIHEADQNGTPLTAQMMSDFYADLNAKYYGDAVERDPEIALEWSRIPHFYRDFYVYQYATGFAAASTLAHGITTQKPQERDKYINFLKSGSSQDAITTMQKAGVNMLQADYLEDAFNVFAQRLTELEKILTK